MVKRYQLKIYGKVQGVYYRASTKQRADQLKLAGFVRNEPDGSVYAEVEGTAPLLRQMIEWCEQGPMMAHVTEVQVNSIDPTGEKEFLIIRK